MSINNTQRTILKALSDSLNAEAVPAIFREKDEEKGIPMDVVSALYTEYGTGDGEVSLDLFFLPVSPEIKSIQYFGTVINIAEDIPTDLKNVLMQAATVLNFITPFGTYVVSPDGSTVFYKLVTPLPAGLTEGQLLDQTNLAVAGALDTAENYVSLLQKLVKGKADLDDFIGLQP